jgi:hypothetical protein
MRERQLRQKHGEVQTEIVHNGGAWNPFVSETSESEGIPETLQVI